MKNCREYGREPFTVAVLHGGPGGPGYMAPVARELCSEWGVLEPLQTAASVDGQVQELRTVLEKYGDLPVTLIGSSWGAMLGYLFAARNPSFMKKLLLVGSGVYEEGYAAKILGTRLGRLTDQERREAGCLMQSLNDPDVRDKDRRLARLSRLFTRADSYNPLALASEVLQYQYDIHQSVWKEAEELRHTGELLELGRQIRFPVVAIHGDYDPHPAAGVREPLSRVVRDFRFILLEKCGHLPWIEREARDLFYQILRRELR